MAVRERISHQFVGSSRVDRGWYRPESQTIEVSFVDGVHWQYLECSARTWENFTKSASPGRFIHDILDSHPHGPA